MKALKSILFVVILAVLFVACDDTLTLQSIKVTQKPLNAQYLGESLDTTGMVVKAYYNKGYESVIADYTVTPVRFTTLGTTVITVSYQGMSDTFTVNVINNDLESITIKNPPNKIAYKSGEKLTLAGMVVEANYTDGTVETITDYTTSPKEGTTLTTSNKKVTITYQDKTTEQSIVVVTVPTPTPTPTPEPTTSDPYYTMNPKYIWFEGMIATKSDVIAVIFTDTLPEFTEGDLSIPRPVTVSGNEDPAKGVVGYTLTLYDGGTAKTKIYIVAPTGKKIYANPNSSFFFSHSDGNMGYFTSLAEISFGSVFDTSFCTDMSNMFRNCSSLVNLDLSSFKTSKVTDMGYMFYGCSALQTVNLGSFDVKSTTDRPSLYSTCIFSGCSYTDGVDITVPTAQKTLWWNGSDTGILVESSYLLSEKEEESGETYTVFNRKINFV